jgi:glycosyltransferase involved in cell wall biosynthesis
MKQEMIRVYGLAPAKLVRIYNPVDIELISKLAQSGSNPFPSTGPNLVAVGRLWPEKGYDLLLDCMPVIRTRFPHADLTIVGDGPLEPALQAQQRRLGLDDCVRFVGTQQNPYPFIKHADVLVLTSRYEALPNVVLEALALGTPVVANNCSGALAEIANTTARMWVAADNSPESLAAGLIKALSTPPSNGLEPQFEARFAIKRVVAQYETVLQASLKQGYSTNDSAGMTI